MVLSCKFFVPYTALQAGFHLRERRTNCTTGNNNKQNHKTMMKKSFYEAPEAELLLVKFEENFLNSPGDGFGGNGQPGGSTPYAPGDETDVD